MVATSITGMAVDHQEPARLYAGDAQAGVFKTASQGRTWLRLGDFQGADWNRPIAVDPTAPNVVYAGLFGGVAKSVNGGRLWTVHPRLPCLNSAAIALDPRETGRLYVTGSQVCPATPAPPCKFYRSLDAGDTWQCTGIVTRSTLDEPLLRVDPFTSDVYVESSLGDLLRMDPGTTWTILHERLFATSFAVSPLAAGTLWAGKQGAVVRSRDGGETWQSFAAGLPSGSDVIGLAPDPVDPATIYAATRGSGVFRSTDGGETWSLAGLWPPGISYQGGLLVDPGDPAIVYAGTDGLGVLRLDQSGS
jgi:photosystem II stability/assembly factor-like uncharacterized protein